MNSRGGSDGLFLLSVTVADRLKNRFSPLRLWSRMWSCVYPVILLLASMKWAEAQGKNDSFCSLHFLHGPKTDLHVPACSFVEREVFSCCLQAGVTTCRQQISFSWSTALQALDELTSCRWRASWLELSNPLPAPSVHQEYILERSSIVTTPGDWGHWPIWSSIRENVGAGLCVQTCSALQGWI